MSAPNQEAEVTGSDLPLSDREALYADVVALAGTHAGACDPELGGFWLQPDYARSYLLGARLLLERAEENSLSTEVALPVAYLQRHSLELGLKRITSLCYEIQSDLDRAQHLRGEGNGVLPPAKEPIRKHDLKLVLAEAKGALKQHRFKVPPAITELVKTLHEAEKSDPTRLRYERVGPKGGSLPSLPEKLHFRLRSTQGYLESAFYTHLLYKPDAEDRPSNQWNLLESLAMESRAAFEARLSLGDEP